ncbi:MAG: glycerophosphodiester phosphodiesterase [Hyphomicrobiales bacterium]|nr:MAG: glycerophosphodiester phosphodiesterase [Hyphomicrobiales bacterium]
MVLADISWLTRRPVAHRGFHDKAAGRVENTLSAVDAAIERGFSIEVDLQASSDGVPMVFHDFTLDRLTDESGPLPARTAAQLNAIRISGTDDHIPTLAELLDRVAGRVGLVIEIKSDFRTPPVLIPAIAAQLRTYDGPAVVMSFDPRVVEGFRRNAPDLPRGIVAEKTEPDEEWGDATAFQRFMLRHMLHAPWSRPHFVAYHVKALPAPGPWVMRKVFGKPLLTWTVRTAEDRATAARHADQMIFEGFDPEAA